jgi:hypothetical protein
VRPEEVTKMKNGSRKIDEERKRDLCINKYVLTGTGGETGALYVNKDVMVKHGICKAMHNKCSAQRVCAESIGLQSIHLGCLCPGVHP